MAYKFSKHSLKRLGTCDERLQKIFLEVIKHIDCTIVEGHRNKELQDDYFRIGRSRVKWPNGNHNSYPSNAVDVAPCIKGKIPWDDSDYFYHFAGFVKGVASQMGIRIRHGYDWDMDNELKDQTLFDGPHFELV